MSGYVPAALRRLVAERAEWLCEYCLLHERETFLGCQVEHIISVKHGGATVENNLAYACVFCNRAKGTDIGALSPKTRNLTRLFNPRTDRWSEHFLIDGPNIVVLTEIGLATAAILHFNITDRILERQSLIRANRFPSTEALRRVTVSEKRT